MNASMVERILAAPATPIEEGGYALRVVRTVGRRSGERRATPLGAVRRDGYLYLVSPQAGRDWVRNLHADPWCAVEAGGERAEYRALVPEPGAASAAVATYLRSVQAPWALKAFPVPADASEARIAEHLETMAVLRLDPS
ncbi:deazaflavin-dependent oxidoreductase (nitroreductase family) [Pseudonocardia sediminis]|uniref:Deazaflavin-dependent oxidoreductase (Nitroreductase family) n=1 Tax=Pseudonocardia sediminis TaxID=1397368 RepID=A0A4Q7USV0_PSEST|nr:nitroreductase family deazaflavin-dependent oxidoreductase [Pseudonocardia sediminis]RZT84795.1 deazaflavin-dependent oxidoreductase (nitroreductase family) [Pseudonocardia sediminis]